MSKYRITIDGKTYELEVELVADNAAVQPAVKREYKEFKSESKDSNINVIDPSKRNQVVNNAGAVAAPMPGTVLRIEKKTGDAVKSGELVLLLEAMKMENEILAPVDGTITGMNCSEGDTVSGGDILFEVI